MRLPEGPLERIARASFTRFTTLSFLYFASGAVGLVDEVIFFKYLSLSFGAIPALLWLILCGVSLICAALIGVLEFIRR